MSTPVIGRNARLLKDDVVIGYGKNISVTATANVIKDYSMDAAAPAILGSGNQTFAFSCERMYIDNAYLTLLLAGTTFTLIFGPTGTKTAGCTWSNCVILSCSRSAGMDGAVIENISGEAKTGAVI